MKKFTPQVASLAKHLKEVAAKPSSARDAAIKTFKADIATFKKAIKTFYKAVGNKDSTMGLFENIDDILFDELDEDEY